MNKNENFKIGDRVVFIDENLGGKLPYFPPVGTLGTIKSKTIFNGQYNVLWDSGVEGAGKIDWACSQSRMRKVEK